MKRKTIAAVLGIVLALSLAACAKESDSNLDNYKSNLESTSTETASDADDEKETQAPVDPSAPITGYLTENAKQYVTLCDLVSLTVDKSIYTAGEEDLQMEIENALYEYSSMEDVDRPSESGDVLNADINASREGEETPDLDETDYTIELGYEEFGPEFDAQLEGCKAGDSKEFSITYTADDAPYDDWVDETVQFHVDIKSVQTMVMPEYDDDFIKLCGFDSKDAYESSLMESIQASYEEESMTSAIDNALTAAAQASEFSSYPDDLYASAKESVTESYAAFAEWFGMTVDEMFEAYGMTEDDLNEEILDLVYRRLVISALCQEYDLGITEGEYQTFLEDNYESYGFSDTAEMEESYGKESIVWSLLEQKAADYIMEKATINEIPVTYDDDVIDLTGGEEEIEDINFEEDGDAEVIEFDEEDIEFEEES